MLIFILCILAACYVTYLIVTPVYEPDAVVVQRYADLFGVKYQQFTKEELVTQMVNSTLADGSLIPKDLYYEIIPLPETYQVGCIYVSNYMAQQGQDFPAPMIIDDTFEVFLTCIKMAKERNINFTIMFSLLSFGSNEFLAYSNQPLDGYETVEIFPWNTAQYITVVDNIGPAQQRGFFNNDNYS